MYIEPRESCAAEGGWHSGTHTYSTEHTQGSGGAVGDHEARVEPTLADQERRKLTQRGVTQPLNPALADGAQLMDSNGQEVQSLIMDVMKYVSENLGNISLEKIQRTETQTLAGYSPWKLPPEMVSPLSANTILCSR